jgi:microcompartment protein CcmL/EutN
MASSRGPALGVLEIATIARGVVAADAGLKRSPAILLHSRAVSGGKHLVFFEGGVAEVEEAMAAARAAAGDHLLDRVELAAADDQVWPMLGAPVAPPDWAGERGAEAVAIVETKTVCAAIAAAYFTLTGTLEAIEAATGAASAAADDRLAALEVIAQPSPDLRGRLFR